MEKINILLFLSVFLVSSYSQLSRKDSSLNHPRNLEENEREIILLGFDNYSLIIPNGFKNYTISFNAYFLFKNWNNDSYPFDNLEADHFIINSIINDTNKKGVSKDFNCTYNLSGKVNYKEEYYIILYTCLSDIIEETSIPKIIKLNTSFSDQKKINGCDIYSSSSVEVFKKDLISLKNKTMFKITDNDWDVSILGNATFISKNPTYFKIKGKDINGQKDFKDNDFKSNNIQLFTSVNGISKKISCKGEYTMDNSDDEMYYFLESKGTSSLSNTDLRYTVANVTTKNKIFIIDFKKGIDTTILEQTKQERTSKGLSTGGIVGIIIPSCLVLFGVAGLAFYLSRRTMPPPPMNNIANKTLGVASSEAIVHQ